MRHGTRWWSVAPVAIAVLAVFAVGGCGGGGGGGAPAGDGSGGGPVGGRSGFHAGDDSPLGRPLYGAALPLVLPASGANVHPLAAGSSGGFDWGGGGGGGGGAGGGSGTFAQQIVQGGVVTVGDIPTGLTDVKVELLCDTDVDVQLVDVATGAQIVAWPNGILKGSGQESTTWYGVTVTYSGYNGDGSGYGHEYIRLTGTTNRTLRMQAYGFAAGYATVNYSWSGGSGGGGGGSGGGAGTFQQQVSHGTAVDVGQIPAGLTGVEVDLTCGTDVDIQLIDVATGTEIVAWPDGILNGKSEQSTSYYGMTVRYSGFNGDGVHYGNEWIRIEGTTTRTLLMKAYGFAAGYATVDYSWTGGSTSGGGGGGAGGPAPSGVGRFDGSVSKGQTTALGDIPAGLSNVIIDLASLTDLDVELYSGSDFVVGWSGGQIQASGKVSGSYFGDHVTWSGWNGTNGSKGREYILISGELKNSYTMKVFGYEQGSFRVTYSWGGDWRVVLTGTYPPFYRTGDVATIRGTVYTASGGPAAGTVVGFDDGLGLRSAFVTTNFSGAFTYTTTVAAQSAALVEILPGNGAQHVPVLFNVLNSAGDARSLVGQRLVFDNPSGSAYKAVVHTDEGDTFEVLCPAGRKTAVVERAGPRFVFEPSVSGGFSAPVVPGLVDMDVDITSDGDIEVGPTVGNLLLRFRGYGKYNMLDDGSAGSKFGGGFCWAPGIDGEVLSLGASLCLDFDGDGTFSLSIGGDASAGFLTGGGSITFFKWGP